MEYESLDELCSLSGRIDFSFEEFGKCNPIIELLPRSRRGKDSPKNFFPKKELDICEVLKIAVKVPLRMKTSSGAAQEHSLSPAELKRFYRLLIREIFEKRIYDLFQRPGFLEGFSNDATSRALNAFSHLFKLNDGPITLFWAIMGIEALYVRGREPKMEQVRERTQVLLGEQTSFKKKISEMYNFRSSFIHSDLDFPGRNLLHDARPEVQSHDSALNEATSMAIAVLTASLQVLISRNWQGLTFSYTVRNPG